MNSLLRLFSCLISVFALVFLVACGSYKLPSSTPQFVYKTEVVQGNVVTSEQVAALRPGIARAQVKNILGTPLLADVFHADRWDYVFTITRDGKVQQTRRLTLYFSGDTLQRFEGDTMPSEAEFVNSIDTARKLEPTPPLQASDQQLQDFARKENGARTAVDSSSSTPSVDPSKVYPSLEPQK